MITTSHTAGSPWLRARVPDPCAADRGRSRGLEPARAALDAPGRSAGGRRGTVGPQQAKATVPFAMLPSNHMLVRAMINGKGPYRLIFDLGAPITLLSNRASEASGVVKADAPRSFLFSMRGEAEVAKLQVGDLTATKLPVIVFDHPALKVLGDVLGRPIDGIIGFTFFARYKTTIDYQVNADDVRAGRLPDPRPAAGAARPPGRPQDGPPPRAGAGGALGAAAGQARPAGSSRPACRSPRSCPARPPRAPA